MENKGIYGQYDLETRLRIKIDKVKDEVVAEITKERFEKEKDLIPELVKECVEWARGIGLKRVNMSNLYVFLNEKK